MKGLSRATRFKCSSLVNSNREETGTQTTNHGLGGSKREIYGTDEWKQQRRGLWERKSTTTSARIKITKIFIKQDYFNL